MIAVIIMSLVIFLMLVLAGRKLYLDTQNEINSLPDIWLDDDDDQVTPVETPTPEKLAQKEDHINKILREYTEAKELSRRVTVEKE